MACLFAVGAQVKRINLLPRQLHFPARDSGFRIQSLQNHFDTASRIDAIFDDQWARRMVTTLPDSFGG
jgi:hypothetical protein